jgi:RTA1 like protein
MDCSDTDHIYRMSFVGPESTFISHTIITKLFVVIDVVCFLAQAAGAGALSGNNASKNSVATGRVILIAGLMLQVVSFSFFVIITVLFDFKARQLKGDQLKQLRPLFTAYYISAFLIIGRSIYRTIGTC